VHSKEIKITKVNPSDWESYKKIRLDALKNAPEVYSSKYSEAELYDQQYWRTLLSDINNIYYFASIKDEIIGVARIALNDGKEARDTAVLCGLYVNSKYRKQGVAKSLALTRLDECFKYKEILKVRTYIKIHNHIAITLYRSLEFNQIGTKEDEIVFEKLIR